MKKIVIIKLGTSIATTKRGRLDAFRIEHIAFQITSLHKHNIRVILIVSAAVACGMGIVHKKDASDSEKKLYAGIGQAHAIGTICSIFEKKGLTVAQLLLTKDQITNDQKKESLKKTIAMALEGKIVLVANENDIIDLNSFGGNDFLAIELARLARASHVFFLSDIKGVYDKNMQVIKNHRASDTSKLASLSKKHKRVTVGGIASKIQIADKAMQVGMQSFIADGRTKDILVKMLIHNQHIGTKIVGGVL